MPRPPSSPFRHLVGDAVAASLFSAVASTFVPTDIAGLAAWWDASDAATITGSPNVTAWSDKSGNGRTLTPPGGIGPETGTITVNGRNVLQYQSGNRQLGRAAFIYALGDCTIFVVGKDDAGNKTFVGEGRSSNDNGMYTVGSVITSKVSRFYHETDAGATLFDRQGASVASGLRLTIVDTTTNAKITDSGGGSSNVNYTRGTFTPDRLGIGVLWRTGTGANINGWLAEIIVYDSALSAPNIALVEAYLNAKWGF